jgi:hypothetical protein
VLTKNPDEMLKRISFPEKTGIKKDSMKVPLIIETNGSLLDKKIPNSETKNNDVIKISSLYLMCIPMANPIHNLLFC